MNFIMSFNIVNAIVVLIPTSKRMLIVCDPHQSLFLVSCCRWYCKILVWAIRRRQKSIIGAFGEVLDANHFFYWRITYYSSLFLGRKLNSQLHHTKLLHLVVRWKGTLKFYCNKLYTGTQYVTGLGVTQNVIVKEQWNIYRWLLLSLVTETKGCVLRVEVKWS